MTDIKSGKTERRIPMEDLITSRIGLMLREISDRGGEGEPSESVALSIRDLRAAHIALLRAQAVIDETFLRLDRSRTFSGSLLNAASALGRFLTRSK